MRFTNEVKAETPLSALRWRSNGYGNQVCSLPSRVLRDLAANGATAVGDLPALSRDELRAIPEVGQSRLEVLTAAAQAVGQTLASAKDGGVLLRITGTAADTIRRFARQMGVSPSALASRALASRGDVVAEAVRSVVLEQLREQEAEIKRQMAEIETGQAQG